MKNFVILTMKPDEKSLNIILKVVDLTLKMMMMRGKKLSVMLDVIIPVLKVCL